MRSQSWTAVFVLAAAGLCARPASAQQTVNFTFGAFAPRGENARVSGDVLVANRRTFVFDLKDFISPSLTAEWLIPLGDYVEAGAGLGFASRTVPTIYNRFVRPDGTEIEQDMRLRTIPMSATIRLLPLGRNGAVQPYVGGGIGFTNWRYSETGDYINFDTPDRQIFRASYAAHGTAVGPIAVFGARVPMGRFSAGGEVRYQKAEGELDEADFFGPKLDLGGFHYVATFGVRF